MGWGIPKGRALTHVPFIQLTLNEWTNKLMKKLFYGSSPELQNRTQCVHECLKLNEK